MILWLKLFLVIYCAGWKEFKVLLNVQQMSLGTACNCKQTLLD